MATKKATTKVATKKEQLPAPVFDEADVGSGFEGADSDAFAVPFLRILQAGSPQCKRSEGAYIKGAEEGMILNTVSQEVLDGDVGIVVVPAMYQRQFIEWQLREAGGGLVAVHAPDPALLASCEKDDKGRDILPNGNQLVDTRNHYVILVMPNGEHTPAIITFSSTQMKKSRQWMSMMQQKRVTIGGVAKQAPMFANAYTLTTVPEANDKGSWFGWRIGNSEPVTDAEVVNAARSIREAVTSGQAQADLDGAVQ
jgi:hypothetical protein